MPIKTSERGAATPGKARRRAAKSLPPTDWDRLAAMTDAEVVAAALTDPDNRPLTDDDLSRMKRRPRAFVIRCALKLSQEAFAERYRIPLGTLRDWEQGRTEPDQAARAYLQVIAFDAEFVVRALAHVPGWPVTRGRE